MSLRIVTSTADNNRYTLGDDAASEKFERDVSKAHQKILEDEKAHNDWFAKAKSGVLI